MLLLPLLAGAPVEPPPPPTPGPGGGRLIGPNRLLRVTGHVAALPWLEGPWAAFQGEGASDAS